jgi:hypothetical protein
MKHGCIIQLCVNVLRHAQPALKSSFLFNECGFHHSDRTRRSASYIPSDPHFAVILLFPLSLDTRWVSCPERVSCSPPHHPWELSNEYQGGTLKRTAAPFLLRFGKVAYVFQPAVVRYTLHRRRRKGAQGCGTSLQAQASASTASAADDQHSQCTVLGRWWRCSCAIMGWVYLSIVMSALLTVFIGWIRVLRGRSVDAGLGLTICKRIVEMPGGSIWAEYGQNGKRSVFLGRLSIGEIPGM